MSETRIDLCLQKMMIEAIHLAKNNHKKIVRFDALASNIPAHHVYEEIGVKSAELCDVTLYSAFLTLRFVDSQMNSSLLFYIRKEQ